MVKSKQITYVSLLSAFASAIYYVESFMPLPVAIPGARWGFSNFPVLFSAISGFGYINSLFIVICKSFIGGILTGRILTPTFFMGLSGAIVSCIVMVFLSKNIKKISILGVSELGAFFSNTTQAFIAGFFIIKSSAIMYYYPYMIFFGIITAFINSSITVALKRSVNFER